VAELIAAEPIADCAGRNEFAACAVEKPVNIASKNRNARVIMSIGRAYIVTR
jgi:hypothetical protein